MAGLRNNFQRRIDSGLDIYDLEFTCQHSNLNDPSFHHVDVHPGHPWPMYHQTVDSNYPGMRLPVSAHKESNMFSLPVPDAPRYAGYSFQENYPGLATNPWPFHTPSVSSTSSSYSDGRLSGSQSPPSHFSPDTCHDVFPSECGLMEISPRHDSFYLNGERPYVGGETASYVVPHDVQHDPDHQFEAVTMEEGHSYQQDYMGCAQEGYVPMKSEDECDVPVDTPAMTIDDTGSCCTEHATEPPPASRLRRASTARSRRPISPTVNRTNGKVTKQGHRGRKSNKRGAARHLVDDPPDAERAFVCPLAIYGCSSRFKSKNEWKRHVNTQHMRLGHWRCNQCPPRETPNDFNRKDLFTQHVRRMHLNGSHNYVVPAAPVAKSNKSTTNNKGKAGHKATTTGSSKYGTSNINNEEAILVQAALTCYIRLRQAPEQTRCLVCEHMFHGIHAWDERLEHIGRHMEAMKKGGENVIAPSQWNEDDEMENWLLREGVVIDGPYGLVLRECRT